jgi:hypothetical protein
MRRDDHSSRGVLPSVVCPMSEISEPVRKAMTRNRVETAHTHTHTHTHTNTNKYIDICFHSFLYLTVFNTSSHSLRFFLCFYCCLILVLALVFLTFILHIAFPINYSFFCTFSVFFSSFA